MDRVTAADTKADELKNIRGIDEKMERALNGIGIKSYLQISKLTEKDIPVMAAMMNVDVKAIDKSWIEAAIKMVEKEGKQSLIDKIGKTAGKDDLKKIKGIGESIEAELNKIGIATYKQLATLNADDIPELAKEMGRLPHTVKEDWFTEARKLMKK